ncbi:MAG: TetR/AcrR family transcriptional regulator [Clostridia bacterium]
MKKVDKNIIIMQAKQIIMEKSYTLTTMDDIANHIGISRRTLYRHFQSKEDLAYEVLILILKKWNTFSTNLYDNLTGTGIMQLKFFLLALVDEMANNPSVIKLIGEFDYYFNDNVKFKPTESVLQIYENESAVWDILLTNILEKGVEDGTIITPDIALTEATISNVLWSFGQRIAMRGEKIENETGLSGTKIIKNQIELYFDALKNKNI